jgi:hypothetical protein
MNHKFFLLFNLYGVVYCGLGAGFCARLCVSLYQTMELNLEIVMFSILGACGIAFCGMTARFLANSLQNGVANATNWENWNAIDIARFDRGSRCQNLADFMGERRLCWLCPVAPWGKLEPVDLIGNYPTYDDISGQMMDSIHE